MCASERTATAWDADERVSGRRGRDGRGQARSHSAEMRKRAGSAASPSPQAAAQRLGDSAPLQPFGQVWKPNRGNHTPPPSRPSLGNCFRGISAAQSPSMSLDERGGQAGGPASRPTAASARHALVSGGRSHAAGGESCVRDAEGAVPPSRPPLAAAPRPARPDRGAPVVQRLQGPSLPRWGRLEGGWRRPGRGFRMWKRRDLPPAPGRVFTRHQDTCSSVLLSPGAPHPTPLGALLPSPVRGSALTPFRGFA